MVKSDLTFKEKLLGLIRGAGEKGRSLTELSRAFVEHHTKPGLGVFQQALNTLEDDGKVEVVHRPHGSNGYVKRVYRQR